MDFLIDFGRGAFFRFSIVILVLGLLRAIILSVYGIVSAYRSTDDKTVPWSELTVKTVSWMVPLFNIWSKRPLYGLISFIWHIGLILVPLFLAAHVALFFRGTLGLNWWPILSQSIADWLTLTTIITGMLLFLGRVFSRNSRFISRFQDIAWPVLLTLVFLTGFLCARFQISATGYNWSMLIHVYSADLVMIMIPFSKVAHCVLMPLSQFVSSVGWKFPRGAGERVAKTLGKEGMPV